MKRTLTIVPPKLPEDHEGPYFTLGTTVIDEHGNKLPDITKITLIAEPNAFWRATIETCSLALPPEGILAECTIHPNSVLEDRIDAIKTDFQPIYLEINLDGFIQIDGSLELSELEELCARVRALVK